LNLLETGYSIFTLGSIHLSLHWLSEAIDFETVDAAIKAHCVSLADQPSLSFDVAFHRP
jgi:hypothetical protein